MLLKDCNPYIRAAAIHPAILERSGLRKAYDYRLFYILENTGIIQINDSCYHVGPDTIIIIPPDTPYDFQGKMKVCVLNFDITRNFAHRTTPQFPPNVENFDPNALFETQLLEQFETPQIIQGNQCTQESVLKIIKQFNTQGEYADAACCAMLKLFFSELLNRNVSAEDSLVEEIMSFVRINVASVTGNEYIAQAFGYHPVYLSSLIKRNTGKTLHAVVLDAKLEVACQWLTGTDEKIDEIANLAGFCSRTHFCTIFKKKLGVSPKEYRNKRDG